jgi:hypothetical protein
VNPLSALNDQILVRGIPTGDLSSSVLDALNGRSFLLQMIYLNSFGQKMVGQF